MALLDHFNDFAGRVAGPMVRGGRPFVPVVRLRGAIGSAGFGSRGITLAGLESPLRRAFRKEKAAAVCLLINSPGGSPVQAAQIAARIRQRSEESGVPVLAFCEDVAASGGYWLACAADEIYADPMSIVGSIGVVAATFGFHELIARWGIERRLYTQGEHKSMLDPFKPEDPKDVERLMAIQADVHEQFKAYVRDRRGEKLSSDEDLFNGDIWTGEKAVANGLIDGIGEMRAVCRERFGDEVVFVPMQKQRSWFQRRFARDNGTPSLPGDWAGDMLSAVEERALWARFGL